VEKRLSVDVIHHIIDTSLGNTRVCCIFIGVVFTPCGSRGCT